MTHLRRSFAVVACTSSVCLFLLTCSGTAYAESPDRLDYARDILPILSDSCYHCHGPDAQARQADLRLDTEAGAKGTEGGPVAIVPGSSHDSELIRRIFSDEDWELMPPADSNRKLTNDQKKLLRRWIDEGASWGQHWSLVSPQRPDLPARPFANEFPNGNAIDWFIDEARAARGFVVLESSESGDFSEAGNQRTGDSRTYRRTWYSPESTRERLVRRVTLDLTGIPPTPEEVRAFVDDESPDAYERLVDRLLASPRFGERMASEWLDLARFADTHGYQMDRYRSVWPYRDWVIDAFNRNLPYDKFVTWQLAGDLLPGATKEQRLATAFQRLHLQNEEGGIVEEEFRVAHVVDRVNTFGTAFLGLTFECARCHDHKYDPITQRDFYSLFSFFQNIDESGQTSYFTASMPVPTMLLSTDEQDRELEQLERAIRNVEADLTAARESARAEYPHWKNSLRSTLDLNLAEPAAIYSLQEISDGKTKNSVREDQPGRAHDGPEIVERLSSELSAKDLPGAAETTTSSNAGLAVRLNGENGFTFPGVGHFSRVDPFTLSISLQTPDHAPRYVVLHHSRAPIDAGSRGYELLLEEGRVALGLHHMWPGNSLKVRTERAIEAGEWTDVAVTYDGSSRASGVQIYVNGEPEKLEIVRNGLRKDITYDGGEPDLAVGFRFRDNGFRGGMVHDLRVFATAITPLEARLLAIASQADNVSADGARESETVDNSGDDVKLDQSSSWPGVGLSWLRDQPDDVLWEHFWQREFTGAASQRDQLAKLRQERNRLLQPIPEIMVMNELPEPKPAFVLQRGEYDQYGDPVEAETPAALPGFPEDAPRNRLGLAQWLLDPEHPLMARVTVNRLWQMVFGRGLVDTVDNFGFQGSVPSHPELLDWLAVEFIARGWDQKAMLRTMVLSATYRQASSFPRRVMDPETGIEISAAELRQHDPENRWFTRASPRRLTAEMLRDQALAVSGQLVERLGGPSVKPYQPDGLWDIAMGKPRYDTSEGGDRYRRALYTYWKRTVPPPAMMTFDAADRNNCAVARQATSTPLQALVLLNDPQFTEASRALGRRMIRDGGESKAAQVTWLFQRVTSRRPSEPEELLLLQLLEEQRELYELDPESARHMMGIHESEKFTPGELADLAAAGVLAAAMLNHDEAIMRR